MIHATALKDKFVAGLPALYYRPTSLSVSVIFSSVRDLLLPRLVRTMQIYISQGNVAT